MSVDKKQKAEVQHDYEALISMVDRINQYFANAGMSRATQAKKAERLGLKHQRDYAKLIDRLHSPGLDRVQLIADKIGIPIWNLVKPLSLDKSPAKPPIVWPFELIEQGRFEALTEREKGEVESEVRKAIEQIEARKSANNASAA